jgi:capsular exopolysaccharide synthesis family protein
MSRIHDALKRAEQERATAAGTHVDPMLEQPEGQGEAMPSLQPAGAGMMPPLASGLSYEALVARCPLTAWKPDARTMLFFQDDESRAGAEEFRTLRSRLYQIREKLPLKRLLITSALPQEGKTFVAANLAQVLVRQQGRRVLVIDADLRHPGLHRCLGAAQSPVLAEYLLGEADEFATLQRGPMENLFFLSAGRPVSVAAELLANGRLKLLLQRLGPLFDWIVLDSSAVVPVSDATVVAGSCDGVLLVVRANVTPSDLAQRAREEFPDKLLLGVVLNGAAAAELAQSN